MEFFRIKNIDELTEVGTYQIKEPISSEKYNKEDIEIIFIPGLAFDKRGYRLGYGGGYYDQYLSDFNGKKVGLGYFNQLVDKLESDSFDIKIDVLITEKRIIYYK